MVVQAPPAPAPPPPPLPPGQDPANPANITAQYGFVGQMAQSIPELNGLLQQATREQWTSDRFLMAVSNTNWYKTNASAVRQWITLQDTDPATAADRKAHLEGDLRAKANLLGLNMNDAQIEQAFYFTQFSGGMSDDNINGYLARTFFDSRNYDWQNAHGKVAETASALTNLREQYGVDDPSNNWVMDQINNVMRGEQSADGAKLQAMRYAATRYSGYADQIEAGSTVQDIAKPFMDTKNQILEQASTGTMDPDIQKALQYTDPNTGKASPLPQYQYAQQLRQDPRWGNTNNARDSMAQFVTKLGTDWGFLKQ